MNDLLRPITCTISGPRPEKLPNGRKKADNRALLQALEQTILAQIAAGYTVFQTGMVIGLDLWAAEIILRLRDDNPRLRLQAFLPYETQAAHWPESWRALYYDILARCDAVDEVPGIQRAGSRQARNRKMIDRSSLLIAVDDDDQSKGETAALRQYAAEQGLRVIRLSKFL